MALNIFVSAAHEDYALAQTLKLQINSVFRGYVSIKLAADYLVGENYFDQLRSEIDHADILIIVATGQSKLNFDFCGFEVGYFSRSLEVRPEMQDSRAKRCIFPIVVGTDLPGIVDHIQGIQIEGGQDILSINSDALRDRRLFDGAAKAMENNPIKKLFLKLVQILQPVLPVESQESIWGDIATAAANIHTSLFDKLRSVKAADIAPERKIIIRRPFDDSDWSAADTNACLARDACLATFDKDLFDRIKIEASGSFQSLFGFELNGGKTGSDFLGSIRDKAVAVVWRELICLILDAVEQRNYSSNKWVVASNDKSQLFRLFVARSITYLSGLTEVHIYCVAIKPDFYGDDLTTRLLNSVSVGLHYRFLFLEQKSDYSPRKMDLVALDRLKSRITTMIRELDILIWSSRMSDVSDPATLDAIYNGSLDGRELEKRRKLFTDCRDRLMESARRVLASGPEDLSARKDDLIAALSTFCTSTTQMNKEFTSKAMAALQNVINEQPLPGIPP